LWIFPASLTYLSSVEAAQVATNRWPVHLLAVVVAQVHTFYWKTYI